MVLTTRPPLARPPAAVYLIISSLLTTLAPIVTKQLLSYITVSYSWAKASDAARAAGDVAEPPHVGRGLGLAFGLFIMQEVASLFNNQYMQRGQLLGFSASTPAPSCASFPA